MDKVKTSDRLALDESYLEEWTKDVKNMQNLQMGKLKVYDPVNNPPHYNNSPAACSCGRRVECIDVTRHYSFNVGNAIKYLWRCDLKGNAIEDLKKAKWYIEDEIAKREKFVC